MIRTKICGITREEDALLAAKLGADAVGIVNVRESKRFTDLKKAKEIFSLLPPFVSRVIVMAPKNLDEIQVAERIHANCIQLHGDETPNFVKKIGENSNLKIIKQIPVLDETSIKEAEIYSDFADAILLDTRIKGEFGGTGITHNWDVSREIVKSIEKPVILAGGLNPGNILEAIKKVKPYAVDVASGVESEPGIKDSKKIEDFTKIVQKYYKI